MKRVPSPRLVFPTRQPFFGDRQRAINKAFRPVESAALLEVFSQCFEHLSECAITLRLLELAVAGLVRWEPLWQILPPDATAQNSKDAVKHLARVCPRPAAVRRGGGMSGSMMTQS